MNLNVTNDTIRKQHQDLFLILEENPNRFVSVCKLYDATGKFEQPVQSKPKYSDEYDHLFSDASNQKDNHDRKTSSNDKQRSNTFSTNVSYRSAIITARDRRKGYFGRTLLHACVEHDAYEAILYLLRIRHPIDVIDTSLSRITPLLEVVSKPNINLAILDVLLLNGANPHLLDGNGDNILHLVARGGNIDAIDIIMDNIINKSNELSDTDLVWSDVIELVSMRNRRGRLPEDVAKSTICSQKLYDIRTSTYQDR